MSPSSEPPPPPSLPSARKVAVSTSTETIEIQSLPLPSPTGTYVLLRIEATGICATDLHLIRQSIPYLKPKVNICGHEGIGRIVGLGPDVDRTKWKVGDRVAHRWIYRVCRRCEMCEAGNEQLCDSRELSGMHVEGCWAG